MRLIIVQKRYQVHGIYHIAMKFVQKCLRHVQLNSGCQAKTADKKYKQIASMDRDIFA